VPHLITCPSGLAGSIRGLKVREERILADRKLQKSGGIVDELLHACWEIRAVGAIALEATQITIGGRVVRPVDEPI
jgi:hypothetical protein